MPGSPGRGKGREGQRGSPPEAAMGAWFKAAGGLLSSAPAFMPLLHQQRTLHLDSPAGHERLSFTPGLLPVALQVQAVLSALNSETRTSTFDPAMRSLLSSPPARMQKDAQALPRLPVLFTCTSR